MITIGVQSSGDKPAGVVGRLFLSLFFLVFAGMGLLFTGLIVHSVAREWQSRGWQEVPCRVLESSVARERNRDGDYVFTVRYEYRWEGRLHESTRWRLESGGGFRDYTKVQALVDRFPAGRDAVCRVNPAAPATAILEHGGLGVGFFIFLPLIFVAIGVGGLWFTWRPMRAGQERATPISAKAKATAAARWVPVAFFGVFLVVGGIVSWFLLVQPLAKVAAARNWPVVPCVVESSRVRSHSDSDGTTYSVDILYRYEFAGRSWKANRYTFVGGSSSGRAAKQEVVKRYPPGQQTVCFVNPDQPSEAVLHRGFTGMMWFGLIPLVFVAVGLGGVIHTLRAAREKNSLRGAVSISALRSQPATDPGSGEQPRELKPAASPLGKTLALLIFALFWNGIVAVFVTQIIKGFARGRPEWFLTLFMIPFVLVGLGLVLGFFYTALTLFNPRPRLRVAPGVGRLGGGLRVDWSFTGVVRRLERLSLTLEGRESATYRRGTDTTTDTSVFARVAITETTDRTAMRAGHATVRLPVAAVAPSFKAGNNKIEWFLILRGDIRRWPDVAAEFPYELLPGAVGAAVEAAAPGTDPEPERSASGNARLGVRGGRRVFRPGEVIEGVAGWSRDKAPTLAEVRLLWFTRGKGTQDVTVVETAKLSPAEREAVQPFRLTLPDGPMSFDGRLVALQWALELVLEPGAESVRWEFALTPGGPPPGLVALPDERLEKAKQWYARFRGQR